MRIRMLCVGAIVVLVGLVGGAGIAHAESEEELREECITILEEGGVPADCQEAPSPILPATNELIWGALSFTILFVLLAKFGYPAIQKGMSDRTERIRSDLESADTAKVEAEAELVKYQEQLKGAREESTRMRDDARSEMESYKAQRKSEIDAELAEYRDRAKAEADAAKSQAMSDVRSEVAALAIGAAEHVVQKSLDRDTNVALVESYINSVAARG